MARQYSNTASSIARIKRKANVRRDFLNGIVDIQELSARHGIKAPTLSNYLKEIRQEIWEEDKEVAREEFEITNRRLMGVFANAVDSYQRSKKDSEEITTEYKPKSCEICKGTGMKDGEWCDACDGDGTVLVEVVTRKIKGQAGDSSHLRIQLDVLREVNRIRGHYPKEYKDGVGNTNLFIQQNNNTIDLSGVPDKDVLRALEAVDSLKSKLKGE